MNYIPAKNSSAERIANHDFRGTAASKSSVEGHVLLQPVRLRGSAVRLPPRPAIEAHSFIFLYEHRNSRASLPFSIARSKPCASSREFRMVAHSIRSSNSKCDPSGPLRTGVGEPDSRERSSIRLHPLLNSTDRSGIRPSPETRQRETRKRVGRSKASNLSELHRSHVADRRSLQGAEPAASHRLQTVSECVDRHRSPDRRISSNA